MIQYLKKGKSDTQKNQEETEVRNKVEDILKELKKGGDKAVLKLSKKFDNYSPKSFRLSQEEIEKAIKTYIVTSLSLIVVFSIYTYPEIFLKETNVFHPQALENTKSPEENQCFSIPRPQKKTLFPQENQGFPSPGLGKSKIS